MRALATNTTHRVMPTAALAGLLLFAIPASADTGATVLTPEEVRFWVNNTWMLVATFFVFLMHLGFATLESGLTRSKNTTNILFKNISVTIGLRVDEHDERVGLDLSEHGQESYSGFQIFDNS